MSEDKAPIRSPPPLPTPVVFGPATAQLFGLYHAPDPAKGRGVGVVLCAPLGFEAMCTHRAYRELAERLATAGFHALRFDYHGTGDSSGQEDQPDRVRAWLDNIGAAVDHLRALSGVRAVDLFGVRVGATLAAVVTGRRDDVRSLVLWAPCASGRAYVRELRAFQTLKVQPGGSDGGAAANSGEEVAGYWFADATLRDLAAIDLIEQGDSAAERALVIPRDDMPRGEDRLAAHLAKCGVAAVVRAEPGYAQMMRDPQDTVVPGATLDAIVAWLAVTGEPSAASVGPTEISSSVLSATSRGGAVREESLRFGESGRLFGIVSEPSERAALRGRAAVVFLNVGANHHVGPNRMYVSLSRELAALGYLAFRFDRAGLGDSPGADGAPEGGVYSKDAVGDVREAITFLAGARAVERVVLVGVCSGAHLAFHAGLSDPRVAGQILINPQTFDWTDGSSLRISTRRSYKSTRYYLGAALKRDVWAQAVRGEVDLRGVAGVLRDRLSLRVGVIVDDLLARWRGHPLPRTPVEAAFCTLSDRGVESLLVFSSSDGGLDMIEEHLGRDARRVRARKNIRLEIVANADHTFTPVRSQREIGAIVTRFVEGAFP